MKSHFVFLTLAVALTSPLCGIVAAPETSPVASGATQSVEKINTPQERAKARAAADAKTFTKEQRQEIERLYQSANRRLKTPEAKESLKKLVKKFPKSNRAGCAVQYLGQMSEGTEKEVYLKAAIKDHGDSYYGDGVQVGAYARLYLAHHYRKIGKTKEAEILRKEILEKFPDAINHAGNPLRDILKK